jgi:DNA-binding transcriptional LysR family regulator
MTYRRLPSLLALRSFEAAARHRSVSRAAAELHVTPGAVSRQLRALEEELRQSLFLRTPTGLVPTSAGETLFAAARDALDRLAEGVVQATTPATRRALTVGAYALFASRWLIPRCSRPQRGISQRLANSA